MEARLKNGTVLTPENYHTPENTCITNSKVGDFLRSRRYFFERHVARTIPDEETPSMQLGSMVDRALTEGTVDAITNNWQVAVLKRDNAELFEWQKEHPECVVTSAQMEKAIEMAGTVLASPWYNEDQKRLALKQMPIVGTLGGVEVSFLVDSLILDGKDFVVTDWKTSRNTDMSPWSWRRKCNAYGYFRQMALARYILNQQYPGSRYTFRHAIIGNTKEGRYPMALYEIDPLLLTEPYFELVHTVREIDRCLALGESAFVDTLPGWESAEYLTDEW